ncbi:MAG: glycosyltransferase family 4 protein [Muribaculum sp.]|nr:glycosyltransferase family 4 protein [Muribaculum sp.]
MTKDLGFKKSLAFGHMVADTSGIVESVKKVTDDEVVEIQIKYNLKGLKFIYVGGLIPRKGVMELLQAWKDAALDNASLMLVGEGHQRQEAEKFIKDNNMENVVFTGAVNYDDLGPYYKVADCFIIPTLEDNWSLVVPEAMAAGLPIACSIYNGCHPELVHPENGWTFDPLNIRQTTETLRTIYDNRDRLIEMGEESRRIVANHTPEHAAKALYDMCLKLTGKE